MRRRDFLAVLLGGAAQRPNALRAAARTARIAILWHAGSEEEEAVFLIPLRQELSTLGWVEGQNLAIENRYPAERPELFLRYASELVSLKPDLIVAVSNQAALAA